MVDADQNVISNGLISANFTNCIIYGNDNPELLLDDILTQTLILNLKIPSFYLTTLIIIFLGLTTILATAIYTKMCCLV